MHEDTNEMINYDQSVCVEKRQLGSGHYEPNNFFNGQIDATDLWKKTLLGNKIFVVAYGKKDLVWVVFSIFGISPYDYHGACKADKNSLEYHCRLAIIAALEKNMISISLKYEHDLSQELW